MKQIFYTCAKCKQIWTDPETVLMLRILESKSKKLMCTLSDCGGEIFESTMDVEPET